MPDKPPLMPDSLMELVAYLESHPDLDVHQVGQAVERFRFTHCEQGALISLYFDGEKGPVVLRLPRHSKYLFCFDFCFAVFICPADVVLYKYVVAYPKGGD